MCESDGRILRGITWKLRIIKYYLTRCSTHLSFFGFPCCGHVGVASLHCRLIVHLPSLHERVATLFSSQFLHLYCCLFLLQQPALFVRFRLRSLFELYLIFCLLEAMSTVKPGLYCWGIWASAVAFNWQL